jgi:Trypsin
VLDRLLSAEVLNRKIYLWEAFLMTQNSNFRDCYRIKKSKIFALFVFSLVLLYFPHSSEARDFIELEQITDSQVKYDNFGSSKIDKLSEQIAKDRSKYSQVVPKDNTTMVVSPNDDPLEPLRTPVTEDKALKNNFIEFNSETRQAPALELTGYISSDRIINGVGFGKPEIVVMSGINTGEDDKGGDCTGVLIDKIHIITARHCVCGKSGIGEQKVTLSFRGVDGSNAPIDAEFVGAYSGVADLNDPDPCPIDPNLFTVVKKAFRENQGKDIALYKLKIAATDRDPHFKPPKIYLFPTNPPHPSIGLIAGYGYTEIDQNFHPNIDSGRRGLKATLTSPSDGCGTIGECIQDKEFVSLPRNGCGNDSCNGDSGGPFYIVDKTSIQNIKSEWIDNNPINFFEKARKVNPEKLAKDMANLNGALFALVSRGIDGSTCGKGGIYTALSSNIVSWMKNLGANPNLTDSFDYY